MGNGKIGLNIRLTKMCENHWNYLVSGILHNSISWSKWFFDIFYEQGYLFERNNIRKKKLHNYDDNSLKKNYFAQILSSTPNMHFKDRPLRKIDNFTTAEYVFCWDSWKIHGLHGFLIIIIFFVFFRFRCFFFEIVNLIDFPNF